MPFKNEGKIGIRTWKISQQIWWIVTKKGQCLSWWKLVDFDGLTLNEKLTLTH